MTRLILEKPLASLNGAGVMKCIPTVAIFDAKYCTMIIFDCIQVKVLSYLQNKLFNNSILRNFCPEPVPISSSKIAEMQQMFFFPNTWGKRSSFGNRGKGAHCDIAHTFKKDFKRFRIKTCFSFLFHLNTPPND